jgi:L-rhamnonate dehydratase
MTQHEREDEMDRSPIIAFEVHTLSGEAPESRGPFTPAGRLTSRYLRVVTKHGYEGMYGPIDEETVPSLLNIIGPFVMGRDGLAIADLWDAMARSHRHSRHGHYKMALSAVDNALWDLRGQALGLPVWRLLGGGSRSKIPVYASTLGAKLDDDSVRRIALETHAAGFEGQKWFPRLGPKDGERGLRRSVAIVRAVRDALGADADIMVDAGGGDWDLSYALRWSRQVADLHPTWLEEPFRPHELESYRGLSRFGIVPLAAGEHLYDLSELAVLLGTGSITTAQCDPEWCGGVSELVRMCAVAQTFGVSIIPHGHGMHAAFHVIASQSTAVCPKGEYLINVMPDRHHFEVSPPTPIAGLVTLPEAAGFGIELDPARILARTIAVPSA